MTNERMVDEIIAARRKQCWEWVCGMRDVYPNLDTKELISRWFDEHPLSCDKKHLAGVVPGRTMTRERY